MTTRRPWWLHWGVILPCLGVVVVALSFLAGVIRFSWDYSSSFESQLHDAGYSNVSISESTTSLGGSKSQTLYIARTNVDSCLVRFERTQSSNYYTLTEANGRAVDDQRQSPSLQDVLGFLRSQGLHC